MPNIREFNNPIDGLQPTDRAVQSSVFAARHTEAEYAYAGHEIGSGIAAAGDTYDKIKTQQDMSAGLAHSSQMLSDDTAAWNVVRNNADPNDHTVAQKFMAGIEPQFQQFIDGFSTQEGKMWATEHVAQLRQHFTEKTMADQSLMAGEATVQNLKTLASGLSNTVMQDHTALPMALGTVDAAISAMVDNNPSIDPAYAAKLHTEIRENLRQEIVHGGFVGMARDNPIAAMQAIADGYGKGDLDATQRDHLFSYAQEVKRAKDADLRAQMAMTKEQQKDDFNSQRVALQMSMFQPDGSMVVPPGFHQKLLALAAHPGAKFEPGAIEALENAAATSTKASIEGTYQRTNQQTWSNLTSRIGIPEGQPGSLTHADVDRAFAANQLSTPDYRFLHGAIESAHNDPVTHQAITQLNQALERVKPLVGKSNMFGQLDQSGVANFAALHYDTVQRYSQLVSSGMSPTEAEKVLEDPRDPRGIMHHLSQYQTTNKQGLQNIHNRVSNAGGPYNTPPANGFTGVTPRQPGESIAAYEARTGGK